jgi:hypothetical protein
VTSPVGIRGHAGVLAGRHGVAAEREEFDGFEGGLTKRGKMRPAGKIHAFIPRSRQTLCGWSLTELRVFPGRDFEGEQTHGKCPECWQLVSWSRIRAAGD